MSSLVPEERLTDVRLIARAAIMEIAHALADRERRLGDQGELLTRLEFAHRVWIRSTPEDDYDPASWESFFHHPETPTLQDVDALLESMAQSPQLWGTGIDLVTAIERVRPLLNTARPDTMPPR